MVLERVKLGVKLKIIIAGGRDFKFTDEIIVRLNQEIYPIATEIISGGAKGADAEGEKWARDHDVPVTVIKANWKAYGRGAGPKRNEEMAKVADAVVLFPGGKGTDSMCKIAIKHNLNIFDWRSEYSSQGNDDLK